METGLQVHGKDPDVLPADGQYASYDEWLVVGKVLKQGFTELATRASFLIGHWLCDGERLYGKKKAYADAERIFGKSRRRLYNIASTYQRIFTVNGKLSFGHHEVVASLPADKQKEYLDLAEREGLTDKALSDRIKGVDADGVKGPRPDKRTLAVAESFRLLAELCATDIDALTFCEEFLSRSETTSKLEQARTKRGMGQEERAQSVALATKQREHEEKLWRVRRILDECKASNGNKRLGYIKVSSVSPDKGEVESYVVAVVESPDAAAATARVKLNSVFVTDFLKSVEGEGDDISIVISGRYVRDTVVFGCGDVKHFVMPILKPGVTGFLTDDRGEVLKNDKGEPILAPSTNDTMRVTVSAKELRAAIEVAGVGIGRDPIKSMTFEACATHVVVTRELLEAIRQEP